MWPTTTRAGNALPGGLAGIGPAFKVEKSQGCADRWAGPGRGGVKGERGSGRGRAGVGGGGGAGQRLGVWCHLGLSKERSSQVVRDFNDREKKKEGAPPSLSASLPCDSVLWQRLTDCLPPSLPPSLPPFSPVLLQ